MWQSVFSCLLLLTVLSYEPQKCTELNFLPMPKKVTCNLPNNQDYRIEDPCRILYHINADKTQNYAHFQELINHQQLKTFHCHISNIIIGRDLSLFTLDGFKYTVEI